MKSFLATFYGESLLECLLDSRCVYGFVTLQRPCSCELTLAWMAPLSPAHSLMLESDAL